MLTIDPTTILDWIEAHKTTVDLSKWLVLIIIAWLAGAFRYLRALTRKPTASIEPVTSRCLIEEFDEFKGLRNVVRAAFLVEIGLTNPTSEKVVIKNFYLSFPRQKFWNCWKPQLVAISLPNRPRHHMGSGLKLLKVWFSNFTDEMDDLTLSGTLEAKEFQSAFLLFVSFTSGNWNPKYLGDSIKVKAHVVLTTGQICKVKASIKVIRDKEKFEEWVPGIIDQISHDSAWGGTR